MASSIFILLLSLVLLHPSAANLLHKTHSLLHSHPLSLPTTAASAATPPPTRYFEVTKPIKHSHTKPCSTLVLQHDFAYTYGKSPVLANYTPPSHCPSRNFSKIVLEWNATCKGRQYDRIFGVWLGGVELLRSCTAEPRATGIVWSVEKDITRYYSILMKNQTLAVYLGNLVDKTYTGIYHVNVSIHFYPEENLENLGSGHRSRADSILPISRNLPLNDGLWFEIENATDTEEKEFEIPQNVYRAVLEVYVSFHENDEFWYENPPNEYIEVNNLTSTPGNGPFREVVVSLDDDIVGAIWPFTVIYTGGVNPLLWRPITGIGSFNLPSYDIEITPFLGKILDGKSHKIGFSVTNALNVWYIDANLHLWLDSESMKTEGELLSQSNLPLKVSLVSDFKGLNGRFITGVSRSISSAGWVKSSHGKITTKWNQEFNFNNYMVMGDDGNMQILKQLIEFNDSVSAKMPSSNAHSFKSYKSFPFYFYCENLDQGNGSYLSVANVTLEFNEKKFRDTGVKSMVSSLKNLQTGQGVMVVKNNLVVSGLGSTQQVYKYDGSKFCYFRNVSSSNYTILYDDVRKTCNKRRQSHLAFGIHRLWPFPARRVFLTSELSD